MNRPLSTPNSALVLLFLTGCSGEVLDEQYDGGSAFRISGAVAPEVVSEDPHGAIAWAWVIDGEIGGQLELVPTEIRLHGYAMDVPAPPTSTATTGIAPWGPAGVDLLIGIPLLLDGESAGSLDPDLIMESIESETSVLIEAIDAAVAGIPHRQALMAMDSAAGLERLGGAPEWSGPCVLDDVLSGLTLYQRDHADCEGWRALATPGSRTEFQGIDMSSP